MFILKIFRALLAMAIIATVGASFALFFEIEQQSQELNDAKPRAADMHQEWIMQNNCIKTPVPCETYSKQFKEWLSKFEQQQAQKEQGPKFKAYFLLKKYDEEYAQSLGLNHGGLATLALCGFILFALSLVLLLAGGERKIKVTYPNIPKNPSTGSVQKIKPKKEKPDVQALMKRAADSAESEPLQAISDLEQVLESANSKLLPLALLLCGSLRVKNKLGEKQGREQLRKVIEIAPQSPEASKAQNVLDAY
jgi:predicted PurR-regulated permease PerM